MSFNWTQEVAAQDHPFFSELPTEMHDQILSYLPEKDISALRSACQQLHGIVAAYESQHATPQVNFHMRRLQDKLDAIKNTSLPTDAESLLAALNIWTSTRGIFENPETSLNSLEKWFSHLAGGRRGQLKSTPCAIFETWALVAMQALRLQVQMRTPTHKLPPRKEHLAQFQECFSSIENLPLSKTEIRALFDRIRGDDFADLLAPGGIKEQAIKGDFHFTSKTPKKEYLTYPGHHDNNFRISPIRGYLGSKEEPQGKVRGSLLPAKIICGFLGLPELPKSKAFCYCVKKKWVTDLLKKRYDKCKGSEEMSPLMKARVLQWVEIF
jgi:hypothetical protein